MFTEQQKDTMRKVFGHMYEQVQEYDANFRFQVATVASAMKCNETKMYNIFRALEVCGYITGAANQKHMHPEDADLKTSWRYVVTEKGMQRYEAHINLH
jgi:hypothetical protein